MSPLGGMSVCFLHLFASTKSTQAWHVMLQDVRLLRHTLHIVFVLGHGYLLTCSMYF